MIARRALAALRVIEPETAHALALKAMPFAPPQFTGRGGDDARLASTVMGLRLPNPIGLAAGFDKAAEVAHAAHRIGFGFHEVGGITPRPQGGNPRPRVFRLVEDRAVVNRLGFNNPGMDAAYERLARRRGGGVVGVNIGANKESADMAADIAAVIARLAPVVDYLSINVSSPNTPGLRDMQRAEALRALVSGALAARDGYAGPRRPALVKIAPDLDEAAFEAVLEIVRETGLEGLVLTNTTLAREALRSPQAVEAGGLSGAPLFDRSTRMLAKARLALGPDATLIGVGGVDSAAAAIAKIEAGANLVQAYTGFVYEGLGLLKTIKTELLKRLAADGLGSVSELVGTRASDWAA
ncbi:MAG: quinone-dependent dihydroorotate dehydrogenase [Pseudomonadota bacterium]